jgi:hypothetical protein
VQVASSCDPNAFPLNKGMTYARVHQKQSFSYPVQMYAPWAYLSGPTGGIGYVLYMERPRNGQFFIHNMAGHEESLRLAMGWMAPAVVLPGRDWTSVTTGISLHGGDWHDTADRWGRWMDTWFRPSRARRRLREIIGFQNVFLRGFDGWKINALDRVPQLAADGRRYGVYDLSLWDEPSIGIHERMDDRDLFAYEPEEIEVLKQGWARARDAGTNVNALINTRLLPMGSALGKQRIDEVLRCQDGSPRTENYAASHHDPGGFCRRRGPNCYVCSPLSEGCRERVRQWTRDFWKYNLGMRHGPGKLRVGSSMMAAAIMDNRFPPTVSITPAVRRYESSISTAIP